MEIQGAADNGPSAIFDAKYHLQRTGLILLDGVIYAGFAGICDAPPWK